MRKLFRITFKLALIGGAIAVVVVVAKKLMGGLGPEPTSYPASSTNDWPSMTTTPASTTPASSATESASDNGAGSDEPAESGAES